MKKLRLGLVVSLWAVVLSPLFAAVETNPKAITDLLNRIGGNGTANRFTIVVDDALSSSGKDVFTISADGEKPKISANSVLAAATGINWYLNHYAHVNLAWNQLTTDLTTISLPAPATEETRTCEADYRYYLNYCTYSYSMCTWTWERWQQEIDWMALHGINMPLQIIGLDVLWYRLLTEDLGYTKVEANAFIAGPSFQAWWGMNNLEGWGGPNPDWWYTRQETLCKNVLERMRGLGMEPVLPGYAGMVPSDIGKKGYTANSQGEWCAFTRPYILDPNTEAFATVSAAYYKQLKALMGTSTYYSIDPFHEGANTDGIDVPSAYEKLYGAMNTAVPGSKWVIQFWQWHGPQYNVLDKVPQGKLIVLDLFSDAHTHFGAYKEHDAVWCSLANFGGRTGLFGRFNGVIDGYYSSKSSYSNIKGIGATPEAIEQVPVLYDALFELPWRPEKPDAKAWMEEYTVSRYGVENADAKAAWEKLRNSALNCTSGLQGPHEAMLCARPALQVGAVSSWGGTGIFYDIQEMVDAAHLLKSAGLSGENYSYDLTDVTRQALTDYASQLLATVKQTYDAKNTAAYYKARDTYLALFDDLDELLNTNRMFMLGNWTQHARGIADEVTGTTDADKNWLELDNARRLITTWGAEKQANGGGLRDYSYREWGGMMKDFYKLRWEAFFQNNCKAPGGGWFAMEDAWVKDATKSYSNIPVGSTSEVAARLLTKYFATMTINGNTRYIYRYCQQDLRANVELHTYRGQDFTVDLTWPTNEAATFSVDTDNDGTFSDTESVSGLTFAVPADANIGRVKAQVSYLDGTVVQFYAVLKDEVTAARTVSVATADAAHGSVAIVGAQGTSVTNTEDVQVQATAASGYDFKEWVDGTGAFVSAENPYTYYGKDAIELKANFLVNKWGTPAENTGEINTIKDYEQYVTTLTVAQNGGDAVKIYSVDECPATLCHTTEAVVAPLGSKFTLAWKDTEAKDGLHYCCLSAYIDLNSDGDFEDDGEFLGVIGNRGNTNTVLHDNHIDVLLPYNVPLGMTRIRLRFDGAWNGGLVSKTDVNGNIVQAMPAKAETYRMVYDVPVDVIAYSTTPCEITVKSGNEAGGTIDANGNTNPYTWSDPNEYAILRAYPVDGYVLDGWTDIYGRPIPDSWVDENNIKFFPPESGTYTAQFRKEFPEELSFDGWRVKFTADEDNNITLTEVTYGNGVMNIPATWNYDGIDYPITALASGFLKGNTAVTSVNIPASVVDLGEVKTKLNEKSWTGYGSTSESLSTTISASEDWYFVGEFARGEAAYNEWGSCIFGTGTDAFNAPGNGFRLYLHEIDKSNGILIVNVGGGNPKNFTNPGNKFTVVMKYVASEKNVSIKVTNEDGTVQSHTFSNVNLADITQVVYALGTGMTSNVYFEKPKYSSYTGDIEGQGPNEHATATDLVTLPFTLKADKDWTFQAHVTNNGNTANQWGSALLASGGNPTADDYTGGFQFYLKKDGTLTMKFNGGSSSESLFGNKPGTSFDLILEKTGSNVNVTLINEEGEPEMKPFQNITLKDITQVSSLIPEGINITYTIIPDVDELFEGSTALENITVENGNRAYASQDGVLYDKQKQVLLRVPEASDVEILTLPASVHRVAEFAMSHAQNLQRVVANEATALYEIPLAAFEGINVPLQVSSTQCETYGTEWHHQLLVQAKAGETVDVTKCAEADILEVCASGDGSGAFSADDATAERWLAYTFQAGMPTALCFPTDVNHISLDLSNFKVYTYADNKFAQVEKTGTTLDAGMYVLKLKGESEATVNFEMAAGAGAVSAEGFAGNGTMAAATVDNMLALGEKHFAKAIANSAAPYAAYLVAIEDRLPFLTATFDEASEAAPVIPIEEYADVELNRTLTAGKWNTLCLPFGLDATQTASLFENVEVLDSYADGVLNFKAATTVEAGVPYIVWPKATATEHTFQDVYFPAARPVLQDVTQSDATMHGNWSKMKLENNEYFISNNTFYYATAENWANLKGFRAYITLAQGNEVNALRISVDGVLTDIEDLNADGMTLAPVSVYDLRGVLLRQHVPAHKALEGLPNGTYIVNGKKVSNVK